MDSSTQKQVTVGFDHNPSYENLPSDIWVDITSRVAEESFASYRNLSIVAKSFHARSSDPEVLRRLSLDDVHWWLALTGNEKFDKFMDRCIECGNPEALYRKGFVLIFMESSWGPGVRFLQEARSRGHMEATYLYGAILISLGSTIAGLQEFSSFPRGKLSDTLEITRKLRTAIRDKVWWRGQTDLKRLKKAYVAGSIDCDCDKKNTKILRLHR